MSPFEMLKLLGTVKFLQGEAGEIFGILLFTLGIALWVLIPFYDSTSAAGKRGRAAIILACWQLSCCWPPPQSAIDHTVG